MFSKTRTTVVNSVLKTEKREIWGWLNSVFNRVDDSRIKAVGYDRAAAEWLLRCGAGVRWEKADEFIKDYNSLPPENMRHLQISEIDATDSAVMSIGFPYFAGLKHVKKAVFHRCVYLDDEALELLSPLKDSLKELQVSACGNVTTKGIMSLSSLVNLEKMLLYDFPEVNNREACISHLEKALPKCKIDFPYALASEQKTEKPVD